jgi:hypothetical protein
MEQRVIRRIKVAVLMAQLRNRGDNWWGFKGEPCSKEIQDAIATRDFEGTPNDEPGTQFSNMYPGDRKRHVARLAYLICNPKNVSPAERDHPVWVTVDGVLQGGAHRVVAHNFLGTEEIDSSLAPIPYAPSPILH